MVLLRMREENSSTTEARKAPHPWFEEKAPLKLIALAGHFPLCPCFLLSLLGVIFMIFNTKDLLAYWAVANLGGDDIQRGLRCDKLNYWILRKNESSLQELYINDQFVEMQDDGRCVVIATRKELNSANEETNPSLQYDLLFVRSVPMTPVDFFQKIGPTTFTN